MTGFIGHWRIAAVLITAAFFSLHAMWIPAKAELAQWLLELSWEDVKAGASHAPPWPWADTQPVAVLEAPNHGIRQLVLSGDSGRNLAFGPAMHADLASRDVVISGHRDTHFAFLRDLKAGDRISLETRDGRREYAVAFTEVVDTSRHTLIIEPGIDRLSLVTCYPFDALTPGGPLRYVVTALPVYSPKMKRASNRSTSSRKHGGEAAMLSGTHQPCRNCHAEEWVPDNAIRISGMTERATHPAPQPTVAWGRLSKTV